MMLRFLRYRNFLQLSLAFYILGLDMIPSLAMNLPHYKGIEIEAVSAICLPNELIFVRYGDSGSLPHYHSHTWYSGGPGL